MLTRCLITLGATTTAGGKVISANSFRSINGVGVAVEDDKVQCPKCKSVGIIKPDGPRLSETCNGKEVALSDDLCLCKCNPPPRLVANQTFASQSIDADWHAAEVAKVLNVLADGANSKSSPVPPDDFPLLLIDPDTHEPFRHRPYKLQLEDKVIEGTTDESGATRPLSAAERVSLTAWHVIDATG